MALLALTGVQSANELIWRLPGDSPLPPTPPLPTQEGAGPDFANGAQVQMHGLQAAPQHNGCAHSFRLSISSICVRTIENRRADCGTWCRRRVGVVVAYSAQSERYQVDVGDERQLKVRAANLRVPVAE